MISIIIPTYNEEKYLPRLLDCIKNQTYKNYEIIVVDANSKDKTRQIAKKYCCKIVDVKGVSSPGIGRNNGAKVAKGKILVFFDADVELESNFLKETIEEFKMRKLGAMGFYVKPIGGKLFYRYVLGISNIFTYIMQFFNPYIGGYGIVTTKKMHNKIGGFTKKPILGEDIIYVRKISKINMVSISKKNKLYLSMRRFESKGTFWILKTLLLGEIFVLLKKDPNYKDLGYEFGHN